MKRNLFIYLFPLILLHINHVYSADKKPLLDTSTSWDGGQLTYPQGKVTITSFYVTMEKGEKLPFHCHTIPTIGYVISGSLEVEKKDGTRKIFKKGQAISEVMNSWHLGRNLSKSEEVKLVVFYLGTQNSGPDSILYNEDNKDKCKK